MFSTYKAYIHFLFKSYTSSQMCLFLVDLGKMSGSPFAVHLSSFGCNTIPELYTRLEWIARFRIPLSHLPFKLSELENPDPTRYQIISAFIYKCMGLREGNDAEAQVKELTKYLKENPPKVSYENPKLPDGPCTQEQKNLAQFIYCFGIDLPGSKHNIYGHLQYYSSFFIDMFFGNYTEFMVHINSLSSKELKKQLKRREGYCQYSPIFAPILGLILLDLETHSFLTSAEQQNLRLMYSGNNEDKHLLIIKKLLKLGADPNAHDIFGFTPLLHVLYQSTTDSDKIAAVLLNKGADPNCECIYGFRPLTMFAGRLFKSNIRTIRLLLQYRAKIIDQPDIERIRSSAETFGDKDLIVRIREAMPRNDNECEKCLKHAEKKCSACNLVFYCSLNCQKMDWKYHKLSCYKD